MTSMRSNNLTKGYATETQTLFCHSPTSEYPSCTQGHVWERSLTCCDLYSEGELTLFQRGVGVGQIP